MRTINVKRAGIRLTPDRARVLIRPFNSMGEHRATKVCARVLALSEPEVHSLLGQVLSEFGERHQQIRDLLALRFDQVHDYLPTNQPLSKERQLLLGAYFTHEYALEAAALFNPSIVPHPDQSDLPPGSLRFILSLRATGEGHISSITFRTGFLGADGEITINTPTRYCLEPAQAPNASYEKRLFERKLKELGVSGDLSRQALDRLGDSFTLEELRASISLAVKKLRARNQESGAAARKTLMLALSNYDVQFAP